MEEAVERTIKRSALLEVIEENLGELMMIRYTNWRGVTGNRRIIVRRCTYGSSEYHGREQWLADAFDVERWAYRTFAVGNILSISIRSVTGERIEYGVVD